MDFMYLQSLFSSKLSFNFFFVANSDPFLVKETCTQINVRNAINVFWSRFALFSSLVFWLGKEGMMKNLLGTYDKLRTVQQYEHITC